MDKIFNLKELYLGEFYSYARVSTLDQNVKQQSKYIREWAKKVGIKLVGAVLDAESGRLPLGERKAFKKLLDRAVREKRGIIVLSLDRLTRNWYDVGVIEKHFIKHWDSSKLVVTNSFVDFSNAMGRLMFRFYMATACFMPEDMREKQRIGIDTGKKEKKYKGRMKGAVSKSNPDYEPKQDKRYKNDL